VGLAVSEDNVPLETFGRALMGVGRIKKEIDGTIIRTHASNHGAGISVVES